MVSEHWRTFGVPMVKLDSDRVLIWDKEQKQLGIRLDYLEQLWREWEHVVHQRPPNWPGYDAPALQPSQAEPNRAEEFRAMKRRLLSK
jgi:hypothetical protein